MKAETVPFLGEEEHRQFRPVSNYSVTHRKKTREVKEREVREVREMQEAVVRETVDVKYLVGSSAKRTL